MITFDNYSNENKTEHNSIQSGHILQIIHTEY